MEQVESKKRHPIDEEILDTFWGLAEAEEQKRIESLESLVNVLSVKQGNDTSEPAAEIVYAVKRLIKGLSSDRGCARVGYAAALEQILKRFSFYTISQLLELVEENLKYRKNNSKAEVSQVLIGKMTAFDSIIRAFQIEKIDTDILVKLIQNVVANGVKKSFLHQMTLEILYEIISKFEKHEFKVKIWPLVEKELCQEWLLEAMVASKQKSHEIRAGSELLLAWAVISIINGTYKSDGKYGKWAISTLVSLVAQAPTTDTKWLLHLMQFFIVTAYFEIQKPNPIAHCEKEFAVAVSPELRILLQNGFLKALGKLADASSGKISSIKVFVEFMVKLSSYVQLLIESSDVVIVPDLMEEDLKRWAKIRHTVAKLQSENGKQQPHVSDAFSLLLLHQGLLIILDRTDPRENFAEIHSCYLHAFKKTRKSSKANSSAGEPMWIDVLVDVLMHLLLQESHLTRNIVKMASSLLHSEYTITSIQLITQVLEARKGGDIGFEGEEEEADAEESDEDGNEDEETEEVEEEDEDEDEETEINTDFRDRIKAVLGDAVVPSDAEESLSDFNDDEMMKIDEMSAQILRQRAEISQKKKQLKEQEAQLRHYKLRCLDLVEDVVRHTDSAAMLFELIMPLLKLMKTGQTRQEFQEIGSRSRKILHEIFQRRKLKDDKKLSTDELQRAVSDIQATLKGSGAGTSKEVALACLFVVRLALRLENSVCVKTEEMSAEVLSTENSAQPIINDLILDFFQRKDSKMQPSFLKLLVEHYSHSVWCLKDDLLGFVLSSDVRIFSQTHACVLLTALLTPKTIVELDNQGEFVSKTGKAVSELILETDVTELKPKFAEQLLLLLIQCLSADKTRTQQSISENFIEKVVSLKKINKDVRKQCNRLIGKFQQNSSKKKERKKTVGLSPVAKKPRLNEGLKSETSKQIVKPKQSKKKTTASNTEIIEVATELSTLGFSSEKLKKRKRSEVE